LATDFVNTDPNSRLSLDDVVETTALVRGGRYLVASHEYHFLCCWDLWSDKNKSTDSATSDSCEQDHAFVRTTPTCPAIATFHAIGRILRVLVQQAADDENMLILAVFAQTSDEGYPHTFASDS
jgi:hypothetical protein